MKPQVLRFIFLIMIVMMNVLLVLPKLLLEFVQVILFWIFFINEKLWYVFRLVWLALGLVPPAQAVRPLNFCIKVHVIQVVLRDLIKLIQAHVMVVIGLIFNVLFICLIGCLAPCGTCSGSSTTCTGCSGSSPYLYQDNCHSICPDGSYLVSAEECAGKTI